MWRWFDSAQWGLGLGFVLRARAHPDVAVRDAQDTWVVYCAVAPDEHAWGFLADYGPEYLRDEKPRYEFRIVRRGNVQTAGTALHDAFLHYTA